ncbi:MAG: MiaB/RimO family radical SAM methylthiotransferase [Candidatus Eisenbacteria bacterium]
MEQVRVYLHPVGCPKANVDLEKASRGLEDKGFKIVDTPAGAQVGILFGCAFIDDAKRESIDAILELGVLKREGDLKYLVVTGCLPEKYAESVSPSLPEVDAFIGNSHLDSLATIVRDLCRGRLRTKHWVGGAFKRGRDEPRSAARSSPWTRTVMISDGCDNACTYCSIPHMRGGLRSRGVSEILSEIGLVVDQGAKEVVLAGQDTASYGRDTGQSDLTRLLAEVAERFPSQWIRLSYVNPDNMDPGLGSVIRCHANVCDYVDMPVQHASPRILAAMGRRDDPRAVVSRIDALRRAVPDIALRTSVIVGFPGETEDDIDLLLDFLRKIKFDLAGVFAFSPQEGTPAATLKSRVPGDVTQARLVEVICVQEEIARKRMEAFVGRKLEVIIEEAAGTGQAVGRSQYDMAEIDRVIRIADCAAQPGDVVTATIDGIAAPYEWSGTCRSDLPRSG